MSAKPKKRIVPTLVNQASDVNKAFEAAAQKKNPLENAADMIAMRYGISATEAPQINEDVFAKNRAIGKKVVPLKEYFEQTATEFGKQEAVKKEETAKKKTGVCQAHAVPAQIEHAAAKPGWIHQRV